MNKNRIHYYLNELMIPNALRKFEEANCLGIICSFALFHFI